MRSKIFNKKTLIYVLAFIIPILLIAGYTYYADISNNRSFFNNGENFLLADMASQYNSLYNYMHDCLVGNESIFYSFNKGLGGNMASTIGYYLASPFNILYMFISKVDTPLMTYIILLIKFGLCSLFMAMFLNHKYKFRFTNLIFALSYALMGFTTVYYFNNMWLDVVYMTPLVMIGIDKLIKGNSTFYVITLALAIIFNFYIAYMLCIFCVIYFLYELFSKYKFKEFKNYKKIIIRFILSSLLAAGISCFILIPALINLSHIMRFSTDSSLLNIDIKNFARDFFNTVFSKSYIGTHNETAVLGRNRPVIYVSLICSVLTFLYFFNKKIKRREKVLSLCVIVFFLLSFMIPHLQLFWQAFSFPNGYIDRFSFLYIFFIIYIASKCFYNLDKIKIRYFVLLIIIYILISRYVDNIYLVFLDSKDILISVIALIIYTILIFLKSRFKKQQIINILLIIIVIFELGYNYIDTLVTVKTLKVVSSYSTHYTETCHNLNDIEDDFYRIDGNYYYSYLDSHTCGFKGVTTALSTNDGDLYNFFYENGGSLTYTTVIYDFNKLPILDSLFGIKYVFSKDELEDPLYDYYDKFKVTKYNSFKKIYEKKYINIYKNNDALSLGYLIDKDYESTYKNYKKTNSFENINSLVSALTGIDDKVLKPLDKEYLGDNTYKFSVNTDSDYLYFTTDYKVAINWTVYDTIYINDNYVDSLDSENIGTVKIKNDYKNTDITLRLENASTNEEDNSALYYLDYDVYEKAMAILKEKQLEDVEIKGNKVSGKISTEEDSTLFLSIPFDKGWNVYVDGKKVDYKKAVSFIAVDLEKGEHEIKLVYYSEGLFLGVGVSILSIGILTIYIIKSRKRK